MRETTASMKDTFVKKEKEPEKKEDKPSPMKKRLRSGSASKRIIFSA